MAITKDINGVSRRVPELGNSGWGTYTTQMLTALIDASLFTGSGDTKPLVADLDLGDNYGVIAAYIKSNSSNLPTTGKLRLANGDIISWRNAANDANIEVKIDSSNRFVIGGVNVPTISSSDALTNKTIDADSNTISNLEVDNLKAGVLDTDLSDAALTDTTIPSAKATKAYVDAVDTLIDNHIIDTTAAHAASAIGNTPSGNVAATDVQAAINELQSDIDTRATAQSVTGHLNDTTAAHAASAISNTPSGNLAATDVQAALNELQSDVDTRVSATSPTIDNGIYLNHETSVTTPASGKVAVFPKSDNNLYVVDSNGVETQVGSGATGAGKKNYILNPSASTSASTGWTAANMTVTRDTSTAIPRETTTKTAFKLVSTAGSSTATFLSDAILLDDADLSKKLGIELAIAVADGSNWTIDVLNSATSGGTYTRIPLPTDVSSVTYLPATTGTFKSSVDMDASKPYIKFQITSVATAKTAYFSDIVVTPDGNTVTGAVVGDWQSYTPTLGGSTTNGTISYTTQSGRYRRVGSSMEIQGQISVNVVSSAPTGFLTWSLPSGTTLVNPGVALLVGDALAQISTTVADCAVQSNGSLIFLTTPSGGTTETLVNSSVIRINANIPIAEWAGSGTVNLAQNDVEYVYNDDINDSNNTSSFKYGSYGALFGNYTVSPYKRVRFQTPTQISDKITLEVTSDGGVTWNDVVNCTVVDTYTRQSTLRAGMLAAAVSNTDVDVYFGSIRTSNNTTYGVGTGGSSWGDIDNDVTYRWRVRKTSAGAAVSFGQVAENSAGLFPAYNTNLDNATATRLGLKSYAIGGTYKSGITITSTGLSSVTSSFLVPYQMQDGSWRMRFNIGGAQSSANNTVLAIANVTYTYNAAVSASANVAMTNSTTAYGSDTIYLTCATNSSDVVVSGDVPLTEKPAWAY